MINESPVIRVIGAGLAGLLTAYRLKECGVDCTVVEKGRVMGGTSGNTTAKITAQHGLIYHKLMNSLGEEKAKLYLKANLEAIEKFAINPNQAEPTVYAK